MTAEFWGLGGVPDPGPKPVRVADGLRKFQTRAPFDPALEPEGPYGLSYRAQEMANHAERAVRFFRQQEDAGVKMHWHTLQFSVERTGMELLPDTELWVWEIWAE